MKRLTLILLSALFLVSCSKDTLEQTRWEYKTAMANHDYTIELNLTSASHGNAVIKEYINPPAEGLQPCSFTHVYDVSYSFDGDESGTITFRKEYVETYNTSQTYFNWYTDTVTSSFYTYAGNNKMFIYTTPCSILEHIELTKK